MIKKARKEVKEGFEKAREAQKRTTFKHHLVSSYLIFRTHEMYPFTFE